MPCRWTNVWNPSLGFLVETPVVRVWGSGMGAEVNSQSHANPAAIQYMMRRPGFWIWQRRTCKGHLGVGRR
jgi:hypothetical protein